MTNTHHIIGHTNAYLAKFSPFNGKTTILINSYNDLELAKNDLMKFAVAESDNNYYNDDMTNVIDQNGNEMIEGELGLYEYDSRYYSIITDEKLKNDYPELYNSINISYEWNSNK